MKKTVGLFVLVMLATAVGVFAAMVLYNGLPEGAVAGSEVKQPFAEYDQIDAKLRQVGIVVKKSAPLPRDWQQIVQTQALQHFEHPEDIRFNFGGLSPTPDGVYDTLPFPMVIRGWRGVAGVTVRTSPGMYTGLEFYAFFLFDTQLLFFEPKEEFREKSSSGYQRFLQYLETLH